MEKFSAVLVEKILTLVFNITVFKMLHKTALSAVLLRIINIIIKKNLLTHENMLHMES